MLFVKNRYFILQIDSKWLNFNAVSFRGRMRVLFSPYWLVSFSRFCGTRTPCALTPPSETSWRFEARATHWSCTRWPLVISATTAAWLITPSGRTVHPLSYLVRQHNRFINGRISQRARKSELSFWSTSSICKANLSIPQAGSRWAGSCWVATGSKAFLFFLLHHVKCKI